MMCAKVEKPKGLKGDKMQKNEELKKKLIKKKQKN
jgi:hypothetical protein